MFYFQRNRLLKLQQNALRKTSEVICGNYKQNGISENSLKYKVNGAFVPLLEKLNIMLLVTREYEHLVIALKVKESKLRQSFIHLPHPNGIAINKKNNRVYIAATRNPNQIFEFSLAHFEKSSNTEKFLTPTRTKFYPGNYYIHDLVFINSKLYANSVGKNSIFSVNFASNLPDTLAWSPLPSKYNTKNHIQLNSIAAGSTLENSCFTASVEKPGFFKPGDLKFPVDKKGVIFRGKDKKIIARGLTRPHSARFYRGKLWVNNSGYGEFGYIENEKFVPFIKLPGWTRGLCFVKDFAFIGVSRVIPKYKVYAPGIKDYQIECGIYAVDLIKNKIVGQINWPYGNQIFGIELMDSKVCNGFVYMNTSGNSTEEIHFNQKYNIVR